MIRGKLWDLLDDASLKKIDAAAIRLLVESGVRIHHEGLLDIMGNAGCHIEEDALRCTFTEQHVHDVLAHYRNDDLSGQVKIPSGWNPQHRLGYGGSYPHLLDWPSGHRRLATKQDVTDIWKMGHAMAEFGGLSKVLTCYEVDQRVEPLWAAMTMAEITDKPIGGGETFYAEYIEPLVRMSEVLAGAAGDTRLVNSCDFWISPLIFDHRQAEVFLEKRRFGKEVNPGTMAISGLSAPVTIPGTAAVATAELMAGLCFGHAVNPDLPATVGIATGSMDLRTMNALFGSPEANLQDLAIQQLFRRLYGIQGWVATGYVDCKRPGIEATFQKMMPMGLSGCGLGYGGGGGLLSAGQDYCPVQHLLDEEIGKALERFNGHFEVDDESLAVDLIQEIATADKTDFLQTDHTLKHYRDLQWYPRWFDRSLWQGTDYEVDAERKMLERIDAHCKDAIRRYERPDIDEAKVTELKKIYAAAEKQLLN